MIALYILIFGGAVAAWFLISFAFPFLGKLFKQVFRKTKEKINEE